VVTRPARAVLLAGLAIAVAGCAAVASRPRTALETRAYRAYDTVCWQAGGPPSLDFVAVEERGRLYATVSSSFGSSFSQEKFDAVAHCMSSQGVPVIWGAFPSLFDQPRR
jgi:hypothetical protein